MSDRIERKIQEGTITRDDLNALIETTYKSAQERILRRTRTRDSNDGHDAKGHAGPARLGSRVAPRRGGGKMNDPTRTARGRRAVTAREHTGTDDPRVGQIVEEWYHEDGSPRYRIMTSSQARKIASKYSISVQEACDLLDSAITSIGGKMPRGCSSHWEAVCNLKKRYGPVAESKYSEATNFILENRGKSDYEIGVADRSTLRQLTARLLTVENHDRNWLYDLYRQLEE